MGAALGALKGKGVQNWLDDIIIYTPEVDRHLELLGKVLESLWKAGLTINLAKFRWFCSHQEFLGMVVDRLGLRPAPSKIEAVQNLDLRRP